MDVRILFLLGWLFLFPLVVFWIGFARGVFDLFNGGVEMFSKAFGRLIFLEEGSPCAEPTKTRGIGESLKRGSLH